MKRILNKTISVLQNIVAYTRAGAFCTTKKQINIAQGFRQKMAFSLQSKNANYRKFDIKCIDVKLCLKS